MNLNSLETNGIEVPNGQDVSNDEGHFDRSNPLDSMEIATKSDRPGSTATSRSVPVRKDRNVIVRHAVLGGNEFSYPL